MFRSLLSGGLICLFLLFIGAPYLGAQVSTADIVGTVTDPANAVIANATVIAENVDTHDRHTFGARQE